MKKLVPFVLIIALMATADPLSAGKPKDRTLTLEFIPQESTGSSYPTLGDGMVSRPVALTFEDGRAPSELEVVGEGTNDDDRPFPWRSTNSVVDFTKEVFVKTVQGWGIQLKKDADPVLAVRLTRFFVSEKDQAVGSTYAADVRVAFELKDRAGRMLASGSASGDARRYGKARSAENCNEVLSDAMKEAYARLFDQSSLRKAWAGKPTPSTRSAGGLSPAALLLEVIELKDQGFSPELLVGYINQQVLTGPLSAADVIEWKKAGLPESVIQAAMTRSPTAKDH